MKFAFTAILFLSTSMISSVFSCSAALDKNELCLKLVRNAVTEYHQHHRNPYYVGLGDLGEGDISEIDGNTYYIMNIWSRNLDNPGECIDFDKVTVIRTADSCQVISIKSDEPHKGPRWDCG